MTNEELKNLIQRSENLNQRSGELLKAAAWIVIANFFIQGLILMSWVIK